MVFCTSRFHTPIQKSLILYPPTNITYVWDKAVVENWKSLPKPTIQVGQYLLWENKLKVWVRLYWVRPLYDIYSPPVLVSIRNKYKIIKINVVINCCNFLNTFFVTKRTSIKKREQHRNQTRDWNSYYINWGRQNLLKDNLQEHSKLVRAFAH